MTLQLATVDGTRLRGIPQPHDLSPEQTALLALVTNNPGELWLLARKNARMVRKGATFKQLRWKHHTVRACKNEETLQLSFFDDDMALLLVVCWPASSESPQRFIFDHEYKEIMTG
jgi:hypothetical protein